MMKLGSFSSSTAIYRDRLRTGAKKGASESLAEALPCLRHSPFIGLHCMIWMHWHHIVRQPVTSASKSLKNDVQVGIQVGSLDVLNGSMVCTVATAWAQPSPCQPSSLGPGAMFPWL